MRRLRAGAVALAALCAAAPLAGAATPKICAASLELAAAAERAGDLRTARSHVADALARDPSCAEAHARLEQMTGPAPAPAAADLDAALRLAVAHPYDPRALLAAARRAAGEGRRDLAAPLLEKVVWLGDVDPGATADALALLAEVDPSAPRQAVPVHVFVDAAARADPGWRFRIRTRWVDVSAALARVLGARFVVLAIAPFDPPEDSDVAAAFVTLAAIRAPEYGIVAGMLEVAPAAADGSAGADPRRGAAEFLGRRLLVRLEPGAAGERLLAHEILHLYGAVHVPESVPSLMNPTGDSRVVDGANRRILVLTRQRIFGPGGVEQGLLPGLDLGAAIDAWGGALRLDLALRGPELRQAVAASALSVDATGPDPHLGDVARWVAALLVAEGRHDEAVLLLDAAAKLHGRNTPQGRALADRARRLREAAD